jgi:uncharacterized coiled-coil DUF342 family protein
MTIQDGIELVGRAKKLRSQARSEKDPVKATALRQQADGLISKVKRAREKARSMLSTLPNKGQEAQGNYNYGSQ